MIYRPYNLCLVGAEGDRFKRRAGYLVVEVPDVRARHQRFSSDGDGRRPITNSEFP